MADALGKFVRLCKFAIFFTVVCVLWDLGWIAFFALHQLCQIDLVKGLDTGSDLDQVVAEFFKTYIYGSDCGGSSTEGSQEDIIQTLRSPQYLLIYLGCFSLLDLLWLVSSFALVPKCGSNNEENRAKATPNYAPWVIVTALLLLFQIAMIGIFSLAFLSEGDFSDALLWSRLLLPLFFGRVGLFLLVQLVLWLMVWINGVSIGKRSKQRRRNDNNMEQINSRESSGATPGVTIDPAYYDSDEAQNEGGARSNRYDATALDSDQDEPRSMMPKMAAKNEDVQRRDEERRPALEKQSNINEFNDKEETENNERSSEESGARAKRSPLSVRIEESRPLEEHSRSAQVNDNEDVSQNRSRPNESPDQWQEVHQDRRQIEAPVRSGDLDRRENLPTRYNDTKIDDRPPRNQYTNNRGQYYEPSMENMNYRGDGLNFPRGNLPEPRFAPRSQISPSNAEYYREKGYRHDFQDKYRGANDNYGYDDHYDGHYKPTRIPRGGVDVLASHTKAHRVDSRPLQFPPSRRPPSMQELLGVEHSNLPRLHVGRRNERNLALVTTPIISPPIRPH